MTTAVKPRFADYIEDGVSTGFAAEFRFIKPSDIRAQRTFADGTRQMLAYGTDYSVSGGSTDDGGTLTVTTPAVAGTKLSLWCETSRGQDADYPTLGTFSSKSHETALDQRDLVDQEQDEKIALSPQVPRGQEAPGLDMTGAADGDLFQFVGGVLKRVDRSQFAGKFYAGDATGRLVPATGSGGGDMALRGDLAASEGELIGAPFGGEARGAFNILKATRKPAMDGLFSSGADQRLAILDFITNAAADGKTIEWGPIDLSIDATVLVGAVRGLGVPSGSRWVMHPNARFRALPNGSANYVVFQLRDVEDVQIEGCGAKLIGERDDHTGVGGEQAYGLIVKGAKNVVVRDLHADDFWGDGFYVGAGDSLLWSEDVLFDNISGNNNRRQGFSLVSAKRFVCRNSRFTNTGGTAPGAGIDVEPDHPTYFLEDILFSNIETAGNANGGFKVFLSSMAGTSSRVGITVEGLRDTGSVSAINLSYNTADSDAIEGLIRLSDIHSLDAKQGALQFNTWDALGPRVEVQRPILEDWNRDGGTDPNYFSAICIASNASQTTTTPMGKIVIDRPSYILNSGASPKLLAILENRTGAAKATAISHLDPLEMPDVAHGLGGAASLTMRGGIDDNTQLLTTAGLTIGSATIFQKYLIPSLSTSAVFTITDTQPVGTEIEFECTGIGAGTGRVTFGSGIVLKTVNTAGTGFFLYPTQDGCILKIKKMAAGVWKVLDKIGTWTVV